MQVWQPHTPTIDDRHEAVDRARMTAWRDLAALVSQGVRVARVQRLVIVRGHGPSVEEALVAYAVTRPEMVLVLADAQALLSLRRHLPPSVQAALEGRLFTAEQFARGQHRAMPYAGLVVPDWEGLDERQRVALEADIRPLVAIGWRP
jgi:hypothetical protein